MKLFTAFVAALAAPSVLGAVLLQPTDAIDVYPDGGPWTDIPIAINLIAPEPSNPVEPDEQKISIASPRKTGPPLPPALPWVGGMRGDWADPYGNVSYGYFSVITLLEKKNQAVAVVYGQGKPAMMFPLRCHTSKKGDKGFWNNLHSWLPWTVAVHASSNWCNPDAGDDNLWINYANQHINVPDDIRCKNTAEFTNEPRGYVPWPPKRVPNDKGEWPTEYHYPGSIPKHDPRFDKRDAVAAPAGPIDIAWQNIPTLNGKHHHRCILPVRPGMNPWGLSEDDYWKR